MLAAWADDAEAMAANILEVWSADREAMGNEAVRQARQFSWDRSMSALLTSVYPKAFRRALARKVRGTTRMAAALVDA